MSPPSAKAFPTEAVTLSEGSFDQFHFLQPKVRPSANDGDSSRPALVLPPPVAHVPSQPLRLAARSIPFDQTLLYKSWSDVPLQPPPHLAAGSIFVDIFREGLAHTSYAQAWLARAAPP